jgi:hypothetical protein
MYDEFDEADASAEVVRFIRRRFLKFQLRHGNRQIVEKSPRNILRIPYVRAVFPDATYLYIVRSPFSFISSAEHKWQRAVTICGVVRRLRDTPVRQLPYWARLYIVQQFNKRVLRRKYLTAWGARYRGIHEDLATGDLMRVLARQWSEGSRQAEAALVGFGEGKVFRLRYEDFVGDPVSYLGAICAHCGLEMTDEMARTARESVGAGRQMKWRRFEPEELARLLPMIRTEMERHGYEVPREIAEAVAEPSVTRPSDSQKNVAA